MPRPLREGGLTGVQIACIGGVNLDIKATIGGSVVGATSNPGTVHRSIGGVAANIATNLARLGVPVSLSSAIGDDSASHIVRSGLAATGVDVTGVVTRTGARTASYVAVLDASGELVVAVADTAVVDGLGAPWVHEIAPMLEASDIWVVDANPTAAALGAVFERRGDQVLVVADPVSAPKAGRLVPFLDFIDVVFPDMAEATVLSGVDVVDSRSACEAAVRITGLGVGTAVVKLGSAGVGVHGPDGSEVRSSMEPAFTVDVTGAGDAFIAGYLAGTVAGSDPLSSGLAAASLTVESAETTNPRLSPAALRQRIEGVSQASRPVTVPGAEN